MKTLAVAIICITGLAIFYLVTVNRATNKLRKNVKTGDRVRFYIDENSVHGVVEKVYYLGGIKIVEITSYGKLYTRDISKIYLSL